MADAQDRLNLRFAGWHSHNHGELAVSRKAITLVGTCILLLVQYSVGRKHIKQPPNNLCLPNEVDDGGVVSLSTERLPPCIHFSRSTLHRSARQLTVRVTASCQCTQ